MKYKKIIILILLIIVVNKGFSQKDTLPKYYFQISGNISVPTDYNKKYTPCFNTASCVVKAYDYYNLLSGNISFKYLKQIKTKITIQTGLNFIIEKNYKTSENYDTITNEDYFYKLSNGELALNIKQKQIFLGVILGGGYHFYNKHSINLDIITKLPFYYNKNRYTSFKAKKENISEITINEWWLNNFFDNVFINLSYNYQITNTISCYLTIRTYSFETITPFYLGLGLKYKFKTK